jgi:hypothetical protein
MRGHSGPLTRLLPDDLRTSIDAYVGRTGEVLFPGLIAVALAVIGLAAVSRVSGRDFAGFYLALTVVAVWASLGPRAGLYVWLADVIPFMSFLRAPARFGVLVLCGLAVFGGWGMAVLLQRVRSAAIVLTAVVVLATVVEARVVWPLRPVPPVPDAYRLLAGLPRAGTVVLHFPYRSGEWFPHVEHMFWSMWHWQPLVNGYSDHIPQDVIDLAVPVNSFPSEDAFGILRAREIRYVAIDWRTYNEAATSIMRSRFPPFAPYLRELFRGDDVSLYEIVAWPDGASTAVDPVR